MNALENRMFLTKHGLLIWVILLGFGFLVLIFLLVTLISESKLIYKEPENALSNPERDECIKWLIKYDVSPVPPLFEGPDSESNGDLIHWTDEKLCGLPLLNLTDKRIRDEDLRYLYYLTGARWLFIDTDTTHVTASGFQQLYYCSELDRVDIRGSSIVPSNWVKAIASHGTITDWNFQPPITDESLDVLCKSQSRVKSLVIESKDLLTENGYQSIGMMRNLKKLMIYGRVPFKDNEIRHILKCTKLEKLFLLGERCISDGLVRKIISLPALKELSLSCVADLSNATLVSLANRPLKDFDIFSPKINDYQQKYKIDSSSALERLVREAVAENASPQSPQKSDQTKTHKITHEPKGKMCPPPNTEKAGGLGGKPEACQN